jgi:hypothetical protein
MKGGGDFNSLMSQLKRLAGNPEIIDLKFIYSPANAGSNFSSSLFNTSDYKIAIGLSNRSNESNECILIKQNKYSYGQGPKILRNFYHASSDAGMSNNEYLIPNPDTMARATEAINLLNSITIADPEPAAEAAEAAPAAGPSSLEERSLKLE